MNKLIIAAALAAFVTLPAFADTAPATTTETPAPAETPATTGCFAAVATAVLGAGLVTTWPGSLAALVKACR